MHIYFFKLDVPNISYGSSKLALKNRPDLEKTPTNK